MGQPHSSALQGRAVGRGSLGFAMGPPHGAAVEEDLPHKQRIAGGRRRVGEDQQRIPRVLWGDRGRGVGRGAMGRGCVGRGCVGRYGVGMYGVGMGRVLWGTDMGRYGAQIRDTMGGRYGALCIFMAAMALYGRYGALCLSDSLWPLWGAVSV